MPRVELYGARKVATAALPGVRKEAAETNLSTGVGVEAARANKFNTLGDVAGYGGRLAANAYGTMRQEEVDRADEVAIMAAENKLARWEAERI